MTLVPVAKAEPSAIGVEADWQKPMAGIGKVGRALPSESLIMRGDHNPNRRKKPMPMPNYEAIERKKQRRAR